MTQLSKQEEELKDIVTKIIDTSLSTGVPISKQLLTLIEEREQKLIERIVEQIRKDVETLAYCNGGKFEIVGGIYNHDKEKPRGTPIEKVELINKFDVLDLPSLTLNKDNQEKI